MIRNFIKRNWRVEDIEYIYYRFILIVMILLLPIMSFLLNKQPTASELLSQTYDLKENSVFYTNVDINMNLITRTEMSNVETNLSEDMKNVTSISLDAVFHVTDDGQTQYSNGIIDADVFGHESFIPVQKYVAKKTDTAITYEYDFESDKWNETELYETEFIGTDCVSFFLEV